MTDQEFAEELIAGLREVFPAAALLRVAQVQPACRALPALGWTPLMLRRWVEHEDWTGTGPRGVLERVRGLGVPPERPRSVVPARQDDCPAHDGHRMRAGTCDLCEAERTHGPPPEFVAARRAAL